MALLCDNKKTLEALERPLVLFRCNLGRPRQEIETAAVVHGEVTEGTTKLVRSQVSFCHFSIVDDSVRLSLDVIFDAAHFLFSGYP